MKGTDQPDETAIRAVLLAVLRHVITAAAMVLIAHGWADERTATGAIDPLAQEALGIVLAAASAGWSALSAQLSHGRWAAAWKAINSPLPTTTGDQP